MTTDICFRSIIRLEWLFNAHPPALHCPRTGELVVLAGEDEVDQSASPYVTFIYPEMVGDLVSLRDELNARMYDTQDEIAALGAGRTTSATSSFSWSSSPSATGRRSTNCAPTVRPAARSATGCG